MDRAIILAVALLSQACASVPADPRGAWWGLNRCDVIRDGGAWCESRNRPWGSSL